MSVISDQEITFVVQGPIVVVPSAGTLACIQSIRSLFPGSEIVLSTWDGADVDCLDFDRLILSKDPGAEIRTREDSLPNNVNRQIVSTLNGLRAATGKYCAKIRTDTWLLNKGFLAAFDHYPLRQNDLRLFERRIVACKFYFRNPRIFNLPFHPSDIFHFGTRSDLLKLWDIAPAPEPQTSRWLEGRARPPNDPFPNNLWRYSPEQYIWITLLQKCGVDISLDYAWQMSRRILDVSERSLVNNFAVFAPSTLGLALPDRLTTSDPASVYSEDDWMHLYRKYCANDATLLDTAAFHFRIHLARLLNRGLRPGRRSFLSEW